MAQDSQPKPPTLGPAPPTLGPLIKGFAGETVRESKADALNLQ
jgi:hypothetical protein